ncbi:MAG: radical SAM protein [Candidatus Kariarchaeaceae archaeon]|jgi:pyruvate formate lyase activating enzyme
MMCGVCNVDTSFISSAIGICVSCLRTSSLQDIEPIIHSNHAEARIGFPLPQSPPKTKGGISCRLCVSECKISENEWGWCGLHGNKSGRISHRYPKNKALLSWYLDAQVTNCCNAWFCPAGTGCEYPKYANKPGAEYGYYNLALFFYGCSFNCLFCQNWQHKNLDYAKLTSVDEIVEVTLNNQKISCWCWFGGSPEPQLSFTFKAQKKLIQEKHEEHIIRFCYEWNGDGNTNLALQAAKYACDSGGNIKFDFKAWNPTVHKALTSMDNKRVHENFVRIFDRHWDHRSTDNPILGISTLLVPHYVDVEEIEKIARFLGELDPNIPYSLLIFHPDFKMNDLPVTPRKQVMDCENAAKKYLNNVNIGNKHLLSIN